MTTFQALKKIHAEIAEARLDLALASEAQAQTLHRLDELQRSAELTLQLLDTIHRLLNPGPPVRKRR